MIKQSKFIPFVVVISLSNVFGFPNLPSLKAEDPATEQKDSHPTLNQVFKAVTGVAEGRKRKVNDLIDQRDVAITLAVLAKMGWKVREAKQLLEHSLPPNDFLVNRFSTKKGAEFMRHISKYNRIYDQLDRIQQVPQGRKLLDELIHGPDGYKLIQYYAKSDAKGRNRLADLVASVNGEDRKVRKEAQKTTGRIYTYVQLAEHLKTSYTKEFGSSKKPATTERLL